MVCTGKKPGPEHGYCRRVEREQMPEGERIFEGLGGDD